MQNIAKVEKIEITLYFKSTSPCVVDNPSSLASMLAQCLRNGVQNASWFEQLIGEVDLFHSSDWIQPPVKSKKTKRVTTVHDLVVYLFPTSSHHRIIANQKRRLNQEFVRIHKINTITIVISESFLSLRDIK